MAYSAFDGSLSPAPPTSSAAGTFYPRAADSNLVFVPATPSPAPESVSDAAPSRSSRIYIVPPSLLSSEKRQYKSMSEYPSPSGPDYDPEDLEKVIGEHREGTDLYYYARFTDGIARRVRGEIISYKSRVSRAF